MNDEQLIKDVFGDAMWMTDNQLRDRLDAEGADISNRDYWVQNKLLTVVQYEEPNHGQIRRLFFLPESKVTLTE